MIKLKYFQKDLIQQRVIKDFDKEDFKVGSFSKFTPMKEM